ITAPQATIPSVDLHSLRLHIRKEVADKTNYGKIYTKVNGEPAGLIQSVRPDARGYVITLDLDSRSRFRLRPGKNVIEIQSTDRNNQSYYASFVLLSDSKSDEVTGAAIEYLPGSSTDDVQAPVITLTQPAGIVRASGSMTVMVQGN